MSVARPPLLWLSRAVEATTVSPQAFPPGLKTPSSVPVLAFLLPYQSHPISIWTEITKEEDLQVFNRRAVSELAPSAEPPYSVYPKHSRSLFKAESFECLIGETPSACVFSIAARRKLFSTLPRCRSRGFASYSDRIMRCKSAL